MQAHGWNVDACVSAVFEGGAVATTPVAHTDNSEGEGLSDAGGQDGGSRKRQRNAPSPGTPKRQKSMQEQDVSWEGDVPATDSASWDEEYVRAPIPHKQEVRYTSATM